MPPLRQQLPHLAGCWVLGEELGRLQQQLFVLDAFNSLDHCLFVLGEELGRLLVCSPLLGCCSLLVFLVQSTVLSHLRRNWSTNFNIKKLCHIRDLAAGLDEREDFEDNNFVPDPYEELVAIHHTSGSKSFVCKRYEMANELGRPPRRDKLCIRTHTRKNGVPSQNAEPIIVHDPVCRRSLFVRQADPRQLYSLMTAVTYVSHCNHLVVSLSRRLSIGWQAADADDDFDKDSAQSKRQNQITASMDTKAARRVAIVGAGTSGLAACKHLLARGFRPVVFEAGASIGGQWTRTLASTRLQSPHVAYRFSDFAWPESVDVFPRHDQVVDYLAAYARRFGVDECVRFRSHVVAAEYVEADDALGDDEMWASNGEAFGGEGAGVWRLTVRHGESDATQTYEFDFLILCIGRFSGVPNIPAFPPNGGPEVFCGRVLHSMDFSNMDDADAAALVKGKRVAVVGSGKSACDIAAECAEANGVELPCSMICRNPQWLLHGTNVWGRLNIGFLYMNRFAELMVRKPGAGMASILLATLLTPLAWLISKLTEAYYTKELPLREYGMEPDSGFARSVSGCMIGMLPEGFYDKVKEGSIVTKRSRSFSFCADGLVLDGKDRRVVPADLVILATGFRGDQKLRDMFVSPHVKEIVAGSSDTSVPLYRECVHPRIPQMAVIGYSESLTNIHSCEMMAKWVARFIDGAFRLPSVRRMEQSVVEVGSCMKRASGDRFLRSCLGGVNIWYNDQLCRDMGCDPRRKKGFVAEWFEPYGSVDYADIQ